MSDRYVAWLTVFSARNDAVTQLAALALLAVVIWYAIQFWPLAARAFGRRLAALSAGVIYVALFVVALAPLVGAVAHNR
jgi:hypothetical protein